MGETRPFFKSLLGVLTLTFLGALADRTKDNVNTAEDNPHHVDMVFCSLCRNAENHVRSNKISLKNAKVYLEDACHDLRCSLDHWSHLRSLVTEQDEYPSGLGLCHYTCPDDSNGIQSETFLIKLSRHPTRNLKQAIVEATNHHLSHYIFPDSFLMVGPRLAVMKATGVDGVESVMAVDNDEKYEGGLIMSPLPFNPHDQRNAGRGRRLLLGDHESPKRSLIISLTHECMSVIGQADCGSVEDANEVKVDVDAMISMLVVPMVRDSSSSAPSWTPQPAIVTSRHKLLVEDIPLDYVDETVQVLSTHSEIVYIEEKRPHHFSNDYARRLIQTDHLTSEVEVLDRHGLHGEDQIVGVSDSGVDTMSCFFHDNTTQVPFDSPDNGHRKIVSYVTTFGDDGDYPDGHGSHVAGTVIGSVDESVTAPHNVSRHAGLAHAARIHFVDITVGQSMEVNTPSDLHSDLFPLAYDAGARIHTNSWGAGPSNDYPSTSVDVDRFMSENPDFLILFAAGNHGTCGVRTVGSPGTAKNALTVGAAASVMDSAADECKTRDEEWKRDFCVKQLRDRPQPIESNLAEFSSRGPVQDGRIKPDVVAPGFPIWSAQSHGQGDKALQSCGVITKSGTSQATPTVAAAALATRQYFVEGFYPTGSRVAEHSINPSASLIKATIIAGATPLEGEMSFGGEWETLYSAPSFHQGFGHVRLSRSLRFANESNANQLTGLWIDDGAAVGTSEKTEYCVSFDNDSTLKVTLVWTDVESSPIALVNLVNNLDLLVLESRNASDNSSQSETLNMWYGNAFGEYRQERGNASDWVNNVEQVVLPAGASNTSTGRRTVTVTVFGENVPRGVADDMQPFSLVVTTVGGSGHLSVNSRRNSSGEQEEVGSCVTLPRCLNNCSGKGRCGDDGVCICNKGHVGVDCSARTCINACSGHGICHEGQCKCDEGFVGKDCRSPLTSIVLTEDATTTSARVSFRPYTPHFYRIDVPKVFQGHKLLTASVTQDKPQFFNQWTMSLAVWINHEFPPDLSSFPTAAALGQTNVTSKAQTRDGSVFFLAVKPGIDFLDQCEVNGTITIGFELVSECPNDCSGHGECTGDGSCKCDEGALWYGADCSERKQCTKETEALPTPCDGGSHPLQYPHPELSMMDKAMVDLHWKTVQRNLKFDDATEECKEKILEFFCRGEVMECAEDGQSATLPCQSWCASYIGGCVPGPICSLLPKDGCYTPQDISEDKQRQSPNVRSEVA